VVCGPSGVGKSTLIQRLLREVPGVFGFSVSSTTRPPRGAEADGVDYHFTDVEAMRAAIAAGEFVEHAEVYGNYYGTRVSSVRSVHEKGLHCLLDIDVQGAESVKRSSLQASFLFVVPPSLQELESRMRTRGTETEESIRKRLAAASRELAYRNREGFWDKIILNGDLEKAYVEFRATMLALVSDSHVPESEVSQVCRTRYGQVLRKQMIVKQDHFPSCWNKSLPEFVDGAPNFRQLPGVPIYGVGQPTEAGVARVIERVMPKVGRLVWINCREEPIIMIDGEPYCVKSREHPFVNQEKIPGDLNGLETKLRDEILKETQRYSGRFLLHGEALSGPAEVGALGQVYAFWKSVEPAGVQTIRQVYSSHPKVSFWRWPITDEQSPEERDFEVLLDILETERPAAVVFNCQMGRGRTTTGMVLARMVWQVLFGAIPHPPAPAKRTVFPLVEGIVRRLGCEAEKRVLDDAIDAASAMQNLRECILKYFQQPPAKYSEAKNQRKAKNYMERYIYLLLFAVYLHAAAGKGAHAANGRVAFRGWVASQPNVRIYEVLDDLHL
jgi:guanylate kinase